MNTFRNRSTYTVPYVAGVTTSTSIQLLFTHRRLPTTKQRCHFQDRTKFPRLSPRLFFRIEIQRKQTNFVTQTTLVSCNRPSSHLKKDVEE